MNPDIQQIEAAVSCAGVIEADNIRKWMASSDIEALGAVYGILVQPRLYERISSPLTFEEVLQFVTRYYARCISENPQSEWADTRVSACMDCANWVVKLWDSGADSELFRSRMKSWLAELWLTGDEPVQASLVRFTLRPLFAVHKISSFFSDWAKDERLASVYNAARRADGPSPIASPEWFQRNEEREDS